MRDQIRQFLEREMNLPSPPAIAVRILEEIKKDECSLEGLSRIIESDPALVTKILKVSNSPYYGVVAEVNTLPRALSILGLNAVKNIVLSFVLTDSASGSEDSRFDYDLFWRRSVTSAVSAELVPYTVPNRMYFSLPDLQGRTHSLPDYHGKVILINFWASWCPPCIYEMPELMRLQQQLAGKPFEILAINVGEKKYKVRKFTKLINFELPVLLDTHNETFDLWGVKTLPTSFLVDASGKVRYWVRGNPGWEFEYTLTTIENLIAEAVNTAKLNNTKPDEANQ